MKTKQFLQKYHRPLGVLLVVIIAVIGINASGLFVRPQSAEQVQDWVRSFGVWGPLVYIGLYIIRPFLLVPSIFFNLSAGILFGPLAGVIYLLLGGLGSAWSIFLVGRLSSDKQSLLEKFGGKMGRRIDVYLTQEDSLARMLWLRLVPIFPYDPVSLVAGCSNMSPTAFSLGTILGMLPGAIAYTVFARSFVAEQKVWLGVVLLIVAFGMPMLWWFRSKQNKKF